MTESGFSMLQKRARGEIILDMAGFLPEGVFLTGFLIGNTLSSSAGQIGHDGVVNFHV